MGEVFTAQVRGLDTLNASLDQLGKDLADLSPLEAAQIIGAAAQKRAPKRTGALSRSFGAKAGDGVVSMWFGVAYAGPINYGVGPRLGLRGPHNIRATRFFSNAIPRTEAEWMKTYESAAQVAVDKVRGA